MELKLKTPWRDGTTHQVMSPLEFMQRLAALVPRPRLHLIRFHGVLAPNAKLRPLVVPKESDQARQSLESAAIAECETEAAQVRPGRISWARLLKPVFDIDMEHCPWSTLSWARPCKSVKHQIADYHGDGAETRSGARQLRSRAGRR